MWLPKLLCLAKYATITRTSWVLFVTLSGSAFVAAQQPVAELGTWPSGAFTLLVGLWLVGRVMMNGDFDTVLPICTRSITLQIPGLKQIFWIQDQLGVSIGSLVLSSQQYPSRLYNGPPFSRTTDHGGIWEWDKLTMYKVKERPTVSFLRSRKAQTPTNSVDIFEMDIPPPEKSNLSLKLTFTTNENTNIVKATQDLFQALFQHPKRGPESTDMFLQYWRALQFYQHTGDSDQKWSGDIQGESFNILDTVKSYRDKVLEIDKWCDRKRTLRVFVRDAPIASNEVTVGAMLLENAIEAGQLVALLIYVQNFPDECEVNPLIPLLLRWTEGKLSPSDNFVFTLSPIKIKQRNPPHEPNVSLAVRYCEIDLSDGTTEIDGLTYFGSSRYPWIASTLCGIVITFFASIASASTPNLATAIGLLLLRPYTNDCNYADAGSPPSWNVVLIAYG
ncbi:hypothetical protein BDD12DRAFT_800776 [Trichophaea hybrida]|nr:hypothetical protein BDD12DRAFT_800776 [Trichophaea hybrida]